jgi:predicted histone-like DNA-binding protein
MAIKFRVIERGQPGVAGGGVKKFYASTALDGEATIDELVQDIEKFSALSEADIRGVIIALENVIQNKLAQSRIVRLEKIGSLYPSLSSNGEVEAAKVTANSIKSISVNYRPGTRILSALRDAGFEKVS